VASLLLVLTRCGMFIPTFTVKSHQMQQQ